MKIKCIGGPNDGEIHHINDNTRDGDTVRIAKQQEVSFQDFDFTKSENIVLHYNFYRIFTISFKDEGFIRFLVPVEQSCYGAVLEMFESYGGINEDNMRAWRK